MSASNWIHLDDVFVIKVTDSAFLIEVDDEQHWIPRSQVADPDDYKQGDQNASMSITEWIAKQKNLAE